MEAKIGTEAKEGTKPVSEAAASAGPVNMVQKSELEEEKKGAFVNEENKDSDEEEKSGPEMAESNEEDKEHYQTPDNMLIVQTDPINAKVSAYIHKLVEEEKLKVCPEIINVMNEMIQTKPMEIKSEEDIRSCINFKENLYEFLNKELELVLPDFFRCPHLFMIDIIFGKKKFLKKKNIIPYKEREYSHLKLDEALTLWIADLKDYLPDVEESKSTKNLFVRDFFFALVNSVLKDKATEHKRKQGVRGKKKGEAKIKPEGDKAEGAKKETNGEDEKVSAKRKKAEKDTTKKSTVIKSKQKRIVFNDDLQSHVLAKFKDLQAEEIELTLTDLKEIVAMAEKEAAKLPKGQRECGNLPPISSIWAGRDVAPLGRTNDEAKPANEFGVQGRPA
jgi:hypothetical protein